MKKKVAVFLFDGFSDWEIAYLTPEIKKSEDFELVYFSQDKSPVSSMGGLRVLPDISLKEIETEEIDMLILPGGTAWEKGENDFVDGFVRKIFVEGKTIAAICGATIYLGRKGFLDELKHTSNVLFYLKMVAPEYSGEVNYVDALAVTDKNVITANGIAPIEFAKEIFIKLKLKNEQEIEKWFQLFKHGIWSE